MPTKTLLSAAHHRHKDNSSETSPSACMLELIDLMVGTATPLRYGNAHLTRMPPIKGFLQLFHSTLSECSHYFFYR
jgi:hypothetical protein